MNSKVCPSPLVWFRRLDGTFTYCLTSLCPEFLQHLNSHNSIKLTIEFKQDEEIPFFDIL